VTIDEAMFLLFPARDRSREAAVREQAPLVASTALTTAAGFGALLVCRFEGLFDLGCVGALGVVLGLVAALVVVPAGLTLARDARGRGRTRGRERVTCRSAR
jgi:predicted RND superfamily exporter protein